MGELGLGQMRCPHPLLAGMTSRVVEDNAIPRVAEGRPYAWSALCFPLTALSLLCGFVEHNGFFFAPMLEFVLSLRCCRQTVCSRPQL